jgi:hypothetical protein
MEDLSTTQIDSMAISWTRGPQETINRSLRTPTHHILLDGGESGLNELYELELDPEEVRNVALEKQEKYEIFLDHQRGIEEEFKSVSISKAVPQDQETRQKLRALGYIK